MKLAPILALTLTALLAIAGCGDNDIRTGPKRAEKREVGQFQSIDVQGATRLEVTVGSPASVELEGRERFLKHLTTEVREGTLFIQSKRHDWVSIGTTQPVTIHITVPTLTSVRLAGGNNVDLRGFDGGALSLRLEGAANVDGSGRLDELSVFMAGAGHADLGKLLAKSIKVTVAGVGSVFVHPEESLDATMNGVGAIFYAGSPRNVSTHVNGLGTIGQRGGNDTPAAKPPIDPDQLQPEYEEGEEHKALTEVI